MAARVLPLESQDIPEVLDIARERGVAPWSGSDYLAEITREGSYVLKVIDSSGNINGFIVARLITNKSEQFRAIFEISNIAIKKTQEKRGYGGALLTAITRIAKQHGPAEIWLEVRSSNRTAQQFYTDRGFTCIQIRPDFYRDPVEDGIVMKLAVL